MVISLPLALFDMVISPCRRSTCVSCPGSPMSNLIYKQKHLECANMFAQKTRIHAHTKLLSLTHSLTLLRGQ